MDEKIKILEEAIARLSSEVTLSHRKLELLRTELDVLKRDHKENTVVNTGEIITAKRLLTNERQDSAHSWLEAFIGLRLIHLVGIIVLVVGLSIGVKYAIDEQLISELMRIIIAYSAGVALFFLSARLKKNYWLFSAILFSGGMASLHFTTYAATVYYQFMPNIAAFIVMAALTIFTAIKAIEYNSREIAIIGMIGAYAIPFLISANSERVDLFFSYILLINIGVVFLSFKKSWRLMNQLALGITWLLFIGWAFFEFKKSELGIAISFLSLFYLLFLVAGTGQQIRRKLPLGIAAVAQILVNNTAAYMAASVIFSNGTANVLAQVTLVFFLLAALMAWLCMLWFKGEQRLIQLLTSQVIAFLMLFIGLQWDGVLVTLLWTAVAVLLFCWGAFKGVSWFRLASVFLLGITLLKLLIYDSANFSTIQKIVCYLLIGVLLLLFSWYYQRFGLAEKRKQVGITDQSSN